MIITLKTQGDNLNKSSILMKKNILNTTAESLKKISSLEEVLEYKNDNIIYKFQESFEVSFELAEDLFDQTKKWLWLCAKVREDYKDKDVRPEIFIDTSMLMIDEMWHTFILFTFDYTKFCEKYFGCYLHHAPTTKGEKESIKKRVVEDKESLAKEVYVKNEIQYGIVYDLLGEDTLRKWYEVYPVKFTKPNINYIRKKI